MLESIGGLQKILDDLPEEDVKNFQEEGYALLEEFVHDYTYRKIYQYEAPLVLRRWGYLLIFSLAYALAAVVSLEFIDRDRR